VILIANLRGHIRKWCVCAKRGWMRCRVETQFMQETDDFIDVDAGRGNPLTELFDGFGVQIAGGGEGVDL